jgi:hypothetical protein
MALVFNLTSHDIVLALNKNLQAGHSDPTEDPENMVINMIEQVE